jgi:Lon protease-like protein
MKTVASLRLGTPGEDENFVEFTCSDDIGREVEIAFPNEPGATIKVSADAFEAAMYGFLAMLSEISHEPDDGMRVPVRGARRFRLDAK